MNIRWYGAALLTFFLFENTFLYAKDGPLEMEQILNQLVTEQLASTNLVGLGAVLIHDDKLFGPVVNGERKKGSSVDLTDQDKWHIGSITKSITATMMGRLVERGELSWQSSIADVFIGMNEIHKDWHNVTLEHLLTHTSGATPNFPLWVRLKNPAEGADRKAARESAIMNILKKKPASTPGTSFNYSNVGYTIAGVMAERKTGLAWEELITQEIFNPLKLNSGGFGPPQDNGKDLSQPRGHKKLFGLTVAASTKDDNTPIMGPAGTIHLSLEDIARYANEHLHGALGSGTLLEAHTYQRLHNPILDDYAYGWVVSSPKDFGLDSVIWHDGSNTMWYALVVILPSLNAVVAITANDGNINVAEKSALSITKQLIPALD